MENFVEWFWAHPPAWVFLLGAMYCVVGIVCVVSEKRVPSILLGFIALGVCIIAGFTLLILHP